MNFVSQHFFGAIALLLFTGIMRAEDAKPAPAPAGTPTKGGKALSLDELFTTLDKDRDGKISKEEATGVYAARFSQWDANGDGFATRQEIHDFRMRQGIDDSGQRIAKTSATSAVILKEPADWRIETMAVPPGFAPDVKITGTEEIRFAPGMFDNTSATYFTCALAITIKGSQEFGAADLKDFLEKYYRGLSGNRAQRKGTKQDLSTMQAVVNPAPAGSDGSKRFTAQIDFFDSFSDGRKITLNIEASIMPCLEKKQTFLILLVSPSSKESEVWPSLRDVGGKAAKNLP